MDKSTIENTIIEVFRGLDERAWELAEQKLTAKVKINYKMNQAGIPALLSATQAVKSWQMNLQGFELTRHQLANFQVDERSSEAQVKCYGTIKHYLSHKKGNVWVVIGNYDFHLVREENDWKIDEITFSFKYQDGNLALPKIARNNLEKNNL